MTFSQLSKLGKKYNAYIINIPFDNAKWNNLTPRLDFGYVLISNSHQMITYLILQAIREEKVFV